jgi:hypothetical protein
MTTKPGGNGGIIKKDEPLLVKARLEYAMHHPLEVLRPI